jgi:hypothetical protein
MIELEIYTDMFHFFHTFLYLSQAQVAVSRISRFVNQNNEHSDSGFGPDIEKEGGVCVKITISNGVVFEHDFKI